MTSELSRSQQGNLSDCIQKISAIIAEASEKPHEPTAEDIALRAARYYPVSMHLSTTIHLGYKGECVFFCAGWKEGTGSDSTRRRSTQLSKRADEWILIDCLYIQLILMSKYMYVHLSTVNYLFLYVFDFPLNKTKY